MQTYYLPVKIEILLFTWLFVSVQSLTHVQVSFCYSRKILFYKSGRWCKDWFYPLFSLKLASAIFYHIFIFHQMKNVEKWKLWKMFFISSKKLFSFLRYSNYVFPSSPLFFPVSHCFRGWSNKNLKVYDVIISLNKNLITRFVWYLEKEISYDIETLSIDRVLNKEHFFWKNHAENVHHKLLLDPFLILLNNPKRTLHAWNSFENEKFWKMIIKKP